ncbi:TA system VapC family ribonuclease toxin [Angustibacter sp. McL0619]|uniref:TA system VapC family ribonuclease toxin n=1 Tax=Angustibacter sp. McL0619 TaxID=3415676 RepID=UPI003CED0474
MTYLLDGNGLIALALPRHIHHEAAHRWRRSVPAWRFATCPITQGTLVRLMMRERPDVSEALRVLKGFCAQPTHEFWSDDLPYSEVRFAGVLGHRQVTDAYLAELARRHDARLATLDAGLAALHPDVAEAIATT